MKFKAAVAITLCLICALMLFTACSGGENGSSEAAYSSEEENTGSYLSEWD